MNNCPCGYRTKGWLCGGCLTDFSMNLEALPDLLNDLTITRDKLDRSGQTTASGPPSRPPLNLSALQVLLDCEVMLRALWHHTGHSVWVPDVGTVVAGVVAHLGRVAALKCVVSYRDQLAALVPVAEELVLGVQALVRLGNCPACETPVGCFEGDLEARCTTCGVSYNVKAFTAWRVMEAIGNDGTPQRTSGVIDKLAGAGLKVTAKDIENWVKRHRLYPADADEHGRHLYNLADVYMLATRVT